MASDDSFVSKQRICAVLGAQWGDEGKGKLVDVLALKTDLCCRFNGGANAGHTLVINHRKYVLHLIPCGILAPSTSNLIGAGVVVHLDSLVEEIKSLQETVPDALERIFICKRAHVVCDIHLEADAIIELQAIAGGSSIGTTKRGIGPCYASKCFRNGLRVGDLMNPNFLKFREKYMKLHQDLCEKYGEQIKTDPEVELVKLKRHADVLRAQIVDGVQFLNEFREAKKSILIEGANAALLDINFGTYPFVTSSNTIAGGAAVGLGLPPRCIDTVVGVIKAYTTRVGNGPFPTELHGATGDLIRKRGKEFGSTTGRPRRCGWLDIPMLKYSQAINGFDCFILTKLDVLSGMDECQVCIAYRSKTNDALLPQSAYMSTDFEFDEFEPIYKSVKGWSEDISEKCSFNDLPLPAKEYVRLVESEIKVPCFWVGVGPGRNQTISLQGDNTDPLYTPQCH